MVCGRKRQEKKSGYKIYHDVLLLFRPGIIRPTEGYKNLNNYGMYKSFFKMVGEIFYETKDSPLLTLGTSSWMACFAIIVLYAEYELSYDRFHRNPNDIHRVVKDFINEDGSKIPDATTPPALAKALREELSEVEQATRLFPNRGRLYLLQYGEKRFYETEVIRADNYFFDVFDFPFIMGSRETALKDVHSIVLTETTAKKYFGSEDPINKVIRINLNNGTDFTVTGILKDVPGNSHFTFDLLIPLRVEEIPMRIGTGIAFIPMRVWYPGGSGFLRITCKRSCKKYKPNITINIICNPYLIFT